MNITTFKVIITGISPIRQHRCPSPAETSEFKEKFKSRGAELPTKEEEKALFELHRYWVKKIGYYQPASHIKKALVLAAQQEKVPGKGNARFSKFIGAAIFIEPEMIPHKNQKDVKCVGHWTVREDKGKKNRVWCTKGEIDNWELEFSIQNTMPELITSKDLENFLKYSGLYCGLGADRPERGKNFGRFEIKKFEEIKK